MLYLGWILQEGKTELWISDHKMLYLGWIRQEGKTELWISDH